MAWIESHQELANHPKTLRLARELRCRVPEAIGYLHLLWWWALSYSDEGQIGPLQVEDASRACHRVAPATRFWRALVTAGFVDQLPDGSLVVHDWQEYAGRLLERRRKDADRKRASRGRPEDVRRTGPNQPTNHVVVGVVNAPGPRAHEPGPDGPLAHAEPERLPNGAQQCPLAPHTFMGLYPDHLANDPRHKIRPEPEAFKPKPADALLPEVGDTTPGPGLDINALHEQLLARERERNHA